MAEGPLLTFRCLIDGSVADVAVHQDHLSWELRPGLFVQRVRETKVVPLRIVSSVTTQRVNLLWSRVRFTAMGNVIEFQVPHDLAARIRDAIPTIGDHETAVIIHNDAVVQGLSELPFMGEFDRWGILTVGTGLGNARFSRRTKPPRKP